MCPSTVVTHQNISKKLRTYAVFGLSDQKILNGLVVWVAMQPFMSNKQLAITKSSTALTMEGNLFMTALGALAEYSFNMHLKTNEHY